MLRHKKKVMRGVIENRKLIPAMPFLQNFTGKISTKCQKRKCCQYHTRCQWRYQRPQFAGVLIFVKERNIGGTNWRFQGTIKYSGKQIILKQNVSR